MPDWLPAQTSPVCSPATGGEGRSPEDPIIKTQRRLLDQLISKIEELHSYEVPEIIAIPIIGGYAPYLDWIREETA